MAVLDVDIADHIAVVRLTRPESRNALNPELVVRLAQAWDTIQADAQIRVVILTDAGHSTFCAGFDLAAVEREGRCGGWRTLRPHKENRCS